MKNFLGKTVAVFLVVCLAGASLSGCAEINKQLGISNETGGMLGGGAAGGLIGYAIGTLTGGTLILTIGGTLLGAFLGSKYGKKLDQKDRVAMATATQQTLEKNPSGKAASWSNPDTGHKGTVVAKSAFKNDNGQHCRQFMQTITVDGKTEKVKGTACRQADGNWRIVS
ncbi:MAG: RT0821/Lpp0805 family surface protein [Nitrospinota bacterium]